MCHIDLTIFYCRQPGCGVGIIQHLDRNPCDESTSLDKLPDRVCTEGEIFHVKTPNRRWLCHRHGGTYPSMERPVFAGAAHGHNYEPARTEPVGDDGRRSGMDFGCSNDSIQWEVEGPSYDDGILRTQTPLPQSHLSLDDIRAWTEGVGIAAGQHGDRAPRTSCTFQEAIYRHAGLQEPRPHLHYYPSQLQHHRHHPQYPVGQRYELASDHLYRQNLYHNQWTEWQPQPLPEPHPRPEDLVSPEEELFGLRPLQHVAPHGDNDLQQGTVRTRSALAPSAPIQRNGPMFVADPGYPSGNTQAGRSFGPGQAI